MDHASSLASSPNFSPDASTPRQSTSKSSRLSSPDSSPTSSLSGSASRSKAPRLSLSSSDNSTPSPCSAGSGAAPQGSVGSLFDDADGLRLANVTEYICTSRLARAAGLYADEPANLRKLHRVLAASSNVKAAAIWFAEDPSRGSCPSALQGQEIGELKVTYSPSDSSPSKDAMLMGRAFLGYPSSRAT